MWLVPASHDNRALFGSDVLANFTCLLVVVTCCPCWEEVCTPFPAISLTLAKWFDAASELANTRLTECD